jgi:hypothetical protein
MYAPKALFDLINEKSCHAQDTNEQTASSSRLPEQKYTTLINSIGGRDANWVCGMWLCWRHLYPEPKKIPSAGVGSGN